MTIKEAEELLDSAVCGDQGKGTFEMPDIDEIRRIGIKNLHLVYYDGGWRSHPMIIQLMAENPHGFLASVLRVVVDERVANDEYKRQTLNNMYNLVE